MLISDKKRRQEMDILNKLLINAIQYETFVRDSDVTECTLSYFYSHYEILKVEKNVTERTKITRSIDVSILRE
jgi:hypothetical protein